MTATAQSPDAFIAGVEPAARRDDAQTLLAFFNRVTGMPPRMWGPSIIGYGRYAYTYDSGRSGEFMMTGFSPRKANQVLYVIPGYEDDAMAGRLDRLGKHKLGKSCLYITQLSKVDLDVLEEIVTAGLDEIRNRYETFDT